MVWSNVRGAALSIVTHVRRHVKERSLCAHVVRPPRVFDEDGIMGVYSVKDALYARFKDSSEIKDTCEAVLPFGTEAVSHSLLFLTNRKIVLGQYDTTTACWHVRQTLILRALRSWEIVFPAKGKICAPLLRFVATDQKELTAPVDNIESLHFLSVLLRMLEGDNKKGIAAKKSGIPWTLALTVHQAKELKAPNNKPPRRSFYCSVRVGDQEWQSVRKTRLTYAFELCAQSSDRCTVKA